MLPLRIIPDEQYVEGLIGLSEARKHLRGRSGKPPSISTIYKWADPAQGYRVKGYLGMPVVLRVCRIGRDLCTRMAWIEEFEASREHVGLLAMQSRTNKVRTNRARASAKRRASELLDADGI